MASRKKSKSLREGLKELKGRDEPKPRKRPKQTALEGMEQERIPDVTDAALVYADIRDRRMDLTKKETEARGKLLEAMHAHKLDSYEDDESCVSVEVVKSAEKVKVRLGADQDDEDED